VALRHLQGLLAPRRLQQPVTALGEHLRGQLADRVFIFHHQDGLRAANAPRGRGSSDLFLYPKGYLAKAPELIIGRYYIDCGLMWQTRNRGDALIDGTPGVFTIHQNHDYTHVISQYRKHESAGARWNLKMIGGPSHLYTWCNATHHYTENGIRHYWAGRFNRMSTWRGPGGNQAQFSNSWLWMTIVRLTRPLRSAIGLVNPR